MRISIFNDIHLEFDIYPPRKKVIPSRELLWDPPKTDSNVTILAGDVVPLKFLDIHDFLIDWFADRCEGGDCIMVPGNHEWFGGQFIPMQARLPEWEAKINARAQEKGYSGIFYIGDRRTVIKDNVAFIIATLWTDFYNGHPLVLLNAPVHMNDYDEIKFHKKRLLPQQVYAEHLESREFIEQELAKYEGMKKVLVTHHAMSVRSIDPAFKTHPGNPYYYSNLDNILEEADLHVHGHVHCRHSYMAGKCRVECNPRGYQPFQTQTGFDPNLVVEL